MTATPNSAPFAGLPPEYAIPEVAPSLAEAQAYCRRLAEAHYENFSVATWFLPERMRPHFYSVYAYCRISDDLGDEVEDPQESLRLLEEWEGELNATYLSLVERPPINVRADVEKLQADPPLRYQGPRHPVFIALRETIRECDIPRDPFADLLKAFRQDQRVGRYETFEDVLAYCRYSANPVGGWCCIRVATGTRAARRYPTPRVRRCNWQISGRTLGRITGRTAYTYRWRICAGSASAKRTSHSGERRRSFWS